MELTYFILFFMALVCFALMNLPESIDESSSDSLSTLKRELIVVSTPYIPGIEIKTVLGLVSGFAKTPALNHNGFQEAEREAMRAMLLNARGMGATAVIDAKPFTSSYQQVGSGWMVSKVSYAGTAVIISSDSPEVAV